MRNPRLLTALLVATAACAGQGPAPAPPAPTAAESPASAADRPSAEELEALYWARADSARRRYTQADVDFVTGMIAHHAQALVMAAMAPDNGAGPELRTLAARIINAQNDEIALMQTWLRDRGQPVPDVDASSIEGVTGGGAHAGHMGHEMMPGMLTREQLEELAAARDMHFERLFLSYMIQHHEGAVTMVHELFATDRAAQDEAAFRLASDIQVDQLTEIERMKLMLQQRNPR